MKKYNFIAVNELENLTKIELTTIEGGSICEDFKSGINQLFNMLLEYIGADGW